MARVACHEVCAQWPLSACRSSNHRFQLPVFVAVEGDTFTDPSGITVVFSRPCDSIGTACLCGACARRPLVERCTRSRGARTIRAVATDAALARACLERADKCPASPRRSEATEVGTQPWPPHRTQTRRRRGRRCADRCESVPIHAASLTCADLGRRPAHGARSIPGVEWGRWLGVVGHCPSSTPFRTSGAARLSTSDLSAPFEELVHRAQRAPRLLPTSQRQVR
jgi:hypothetical protein